MAQPESPKAKFNIVVFNKRFFGLSETFIFRQVQALKTRFSVQLVGFQIKQQSFSSEVNNSVSIVNDGKSILRVAIQLIWKKLTGRRLSERPVIYKSLDSTLKQKPTLIHAHYGWNGVMLYPYARDRDIPLVVSFHGSDASEKLSNASYRAQLSALFQYSAAIVLCSEHMISKLELESYLQKVHIVPYGIDTADFKPDNPANSRGFIEILHAGRLVAKKGVPSLIRVFARLCGQHDVRLTIIGDGPDRISCEAAIRDLNVGDRVELLGAQSMSVVKQRMNACDIFVLNSRTDANGDMEGLPNAILEAMAFERPVVSTRHAGIPMALTDGENGLLVDEGDDDALSEKLSLLLTNPDLRKRLGQNARRTILDKFDSKKTNEQLVNVFNGIIANLPNGAV